LIDGGGAMVGFCVKRREKRRREERKTKPSRVLNTMFSGGVNPSHGASLFLHFYAQLRFVLCSLFFVLQLAGGPFEIRKGHRVQKN
jgi:hypothetical protein